MIFKSLNKLPIPLKPFWAMALLVAVLVGFFPGTLEKAEGSSFKTQSIQKFENHKPVLQGFDCIRHESKCTLLRERLGVGKTRPLPCYADLISTPSLEISNRASLVYLEPHQVHSREFLNLSILKSIHHPPTV